MPRAHVVFDCNTYRALSDSAMSGVESAERSHSVQALASKHVCAELLAHLATPTDPAFLPALAAVRRLTWHCAGYDGSKKVVRFMVETDEQLLYSLFGERGRRDESAEALGRFLGMIVESTDIHANTKTLKALETIAESVSERENEFVSDVWQQLVLRFEPSAKDWSVFQKDRARQTALAEAIESDHGMNACARMFSASVARESRSALNENAIQRAAWVLREQFPTALRLYNRVLARVVRTGCNLSKASRANWYWDIHLAFLVSQLVKIEQAPVWLVTSDEFLADTAHEAGATGLVYTLDSYRSVLLKNGDDFYAHLQWGI